MEYSTNCLDNPLEAVEIDDDAFIFEPEKPEEARKYKPTDEKAAAGFHKAACLAFKLAGWRAKIDCWRDLDGNEKFRDANEIVHRRLANSPISGLVEYLSEGAIQDIAVVIIGYSAVVGAGIKEKKARGARGSNNTTETTEDHTTETTEAWRDKGNVITVEGDFYNE